MSLLLLFSIFGNFLKHLIVVSLHLRNMESDFLFHIILQELSCIRSSNYIVLNQRFKRLFHIKVQRLTLNIKGHFAPETLRFIDQLYPESTATVIQQ